MDWITPMFTRARALLPFALIALAGVLGFAWMCDGVGDRDGVTYVDAPIASWFAAHRTVSEGQIGLLLAKATTPIVLIAGVIVTALVLWRYGRKLEAALLGGSVFIAYAVGYVAKHLEGRPRPLAPINLAPESEASFPSGHVLVIATIAFIAIGLAWHHMGTAMRAIALTAAVLATLTVSLDRLIVGAHWMTDVLGSLFLASAIVAVTLSIHTALTPSH